MRKTHFVNQECYHIYNRGVDKRDIFLDQGDYLRFIAYMNKIKETKLDNDQFSFFDSVEFVCFCLNPNHYHFIIKQLKDEGISRFMHFLATSYTMFFNTKYRRSGSLFQGPFKAKQVKSFDHLLWLSVYVNANAQIHGIINDSSNYQWCSYPYYLGIEEGNICNKNNILETVDNYGEYAKETAIIMKKRKEDAKYTELEI